MNGSNDNKNNDESTNYETCEIENIMKHEKSEDTGMEVSVEEKASESGKKDNVRNKENIANGLFDSSVSSSSPMK